MSRRFLKDVVLIGSKGDKERAFRMTSRFQGGGLRILLGILILNDLIRFFRSGSSDEFKLFKNKTVCTERGFIALNS